MVLKYLIQTSIFRYSKNYGSLTHETRIKDAVNMGDLICLLATVRTLNLSTEKVTLNVCTLAVHSLMVKKKKKKKRGTRNHLDE